MNSQPDVKRSYDSPLRKAQAAATRRAIIDAAAASFIERGYVATSIETIAEAAGVSRATVFTSVGGKKELLKKAYDVALVGDDEPIPFPLRPASMAVRAEPDPRRFLVGYAGLLIDMHARLAPIYEAVRGAASADPEVRDVFEAIVTERRIGAGNVVRDLLAKGADAPRRTRRGRGGGHPVGAHRCRAVPSPRQSTGLDEGALPGVAGRDDAATAPRLIAA